MRETNQQRKDKADRRRKKIRMLRNTGLTWTEIAKIYDISRQRAQQLGKELKNE